MVGAACLEMKDDAPDKTEDSRRVAIDDAGGGDARQLHLRGRRAKVQSRKIAACRRVPTSRRTRLFIAQERQNLGDVLQSEDALRRRPEPVELNGRVCLFIPCETHITPVLISLHSGPALVSRY